MYISKLENGELIDGMIGNDCGDVPRKYNMDYINAKSLLLQASSTTGAKITKSFVQTNEF